MKKLFFAVFAGLLLCACTKSGTEINAESKIKWMNDLTQGLTLAKQQNKNVMADFGAEWCGWCKKMDNDVFMQDNIAKLSESFVCVRVDVDKSPADARKYGVSGLPTVLFLNGDGKIIRQSVGYSDAAEFEKAMKEVLETK